MQWCSVMFDHIRLPNNTNTNKTLDGNNECICKYWGWDTNNKHITPENSSDTQHLHYNRTITTQ